MSKFSQLTYKERLDLIMSGTGKETDSGLEFELEPGHTLTLSWKYLAHVLFQQFDMLRKQIRLPEGVTEYTHIGPKENI